MPRAGLVSNGLAAAAAISANDVWAVGSYYKAGLTHPLAEHWNGSSWSVASVPEPGTHDNWLSGVFALSATDVWAVGSSWNGSGSRNTTLALHWDGSAWTQKPSANQGMEGSFLTSVAMLSPTDGWAVGYYFDQSADTNQSLIERWDGSSWYAVPGTEPELGQLTYLYGVAAISSTDAWAVGYFQAHIDGLFHAFALHWNGTSWSVLDGGGLDEAGGHYLTGVAADSSTDVWAAGFTDTTGTGQTLIEHWNGTQWEVQSSPNPGDAAALNSVAALSSTNAWAVGSRTDGGIPHTLIEHFNGTVWTAVSSPNVRPGGNDLLGVSAASAKSLWAVGSQNSQTLVETGNATGFGVIGSADGGNGYNQLTAVDADSASGAWAVGSYLDEYGKKRLLAEHWDGNAWTIVPTPQVYPDGDWFTGVVAISPTDVWAVGDGTDQFGRNRNVLEHWNGTSWTAGGRADSFQYVAAASAVSTDDVWEVGWFNPGSVDRTAAQHWHNSFWGEVTPDNSGHSSTPNRLLAVSAVALDHAWAVGETDTAEGSKVLTELRSGPAWSIVKAPSGGAVNATLAGVHASPDTDDVWAVGNADDAALIERYDGSTWKRVAVPAATTSDILQSVDGATTGDIWAVGGSAAGALIDHWDGTAWRVVPGAPEGSVGSLSGVSATSDGQVWAVGIQVLGGLVQGLAEHLCPLLVLDDGFQPARVTVAQGSTIAWAIPASDGMNHSITDGTGLDLFDSQLRSPGSSFIAKFTGAGEYTVVDSATGHTQLIRVPVLVSPTGGGTRTRFRVTWASARMPRDYAFDIQVKRPDSSFQPWQTAVRTTGAGFVPDGGAGTYEFRARVRDIQTGARSAFSPLASIAVKA